MKKTVFLTILIAAVFALLSCATTGEGDTGVGAAVQESGAQGVAVEEDNAQPADVTTGTDGSRTEGVTSGGEAGTLTEIEPTGTAVDRTEDSEPAANNAETAGAGGIAPIPFQPRVEPEAPLTGQEISIVLDASAYDAVTYDFGEGATERATYTYESFGVKTVTVSAVSVNASVSAQVAFPVRGNATLRVERNEAEHDVLWNPVLNAELDAGGDFDTIVVYEKGREVLRTAALQGYVLPVPFVGERVFTAALFHKGFRVADVGEVRITGLNSAPLKPAYEGAQFIQVSPGEEVRFSVTATDPNNDPVRYQVKFAPEGAQFDEETGTFTWIPTRSQRGVHLLHFTAFDIPFDLASPFAQRGIIVQ